MESTERRRERSEDRGIATRLYLEALASRDGHRAVAVANQARLPVAGSAAAGGEVEVAAAVASVARTHPALASERLHRYGGGGAGPLHVGDVTVAGEPCFLVGLGGDRLPADDVQAALDRILGV